MFHHLEPQMDSMHPEGMAAQGTTAPCVLLQMKPSITGE
jgi:hypothetical protein